MAEIKAGVVNLFDYKVDALSLLSWVLVTISVPPLSLSDNFLMLPAQIAVVKS